ncbi:unnamed protein product [Didymodactylos carnosus]|uniref:Uncharacterized protein n=1 Tax=Didymodactylos carnosus TaxID=1234261 RepID=A0A815Q5T6_9BILA|nr:unnamed protein product [Didymodactylos carnosus]CAF4329826.1 unnamed protein product [Didymodactylos carnosus]
MSNCPREQLSVSRIIDTIDSKNPTLWFRVAQDGTWLGKYCNCLIVTLSWLDIGITSQQPHHMTILGIFRIPKETREALEKCVSADFINMFRKGQHFHRNIIQHYSSLAKQEKGYMERPLYGSYFEIMIHIFDTWANTYFESQDPDEDEVIEDSDDEDESW